VAASFCSDCGSALREGARFCQACGAAVVVQTDDGKPIELRGPGVAANTVSATEGVPRPSAAAAPGNNEPNARPRAVTGQSSPDGKWWWDGQQWLPVPVAQTALESGPTRKNSWKLPPGEYTTDRKWRLENGRWVATGKWERRENQYVRTDASAIVANAGEPPEKLLKAGRLLVFRDGSSQRVDEQRRPTSFRTTNTQALFVVVPVMVFVVLVLWWTITHVIAT
jgi:hypothetical protein